MPRSARDEGVLVIGLGRFGASIALTLEKLGTQVLAIDTDEELVQKHSGQLTHVVRADATQPEVLDQIGASDFSIAVVGVGTSVEASVPIAANLRGLGNPVIWSEAISAAHGRILQRMGCHHVVYPEADARKRGAHRVNGRLMDFIEFGGDLAVVKIRTPHEVQGMT